MYEVSWMILKACTLMFTGMFARRTHCFEGEGHLNLLTLWKTNMEPKNGGLEDGIPFQRGEF